jgi:hypothetical protein
MVSKLMTIEEWKSFGEFVGRYEFSNMGRIRSLMNGDKSREEPRVLKTYNSKKGYSWGRMYFNGEKRSAQVHRLVMTAFIGSAPEGCNIDHINGDKSDNRLSNLEYVTNRENKLRGVTGKKVYSQLRGVTFDKQICRWKSQIRDSTGRKIHIGTFDSDIEASSAYSEILRIIHLDRHDVMKKVMKFRRK